jgi:hypothetical protein
MACFVNYSFVLFAIALMHQAALAQTEDHRLALPDKSSPTFHTRPEIKPQNAMKSADTVKAKVMAHEKRAKGSPEPTGSTGVAAVTAGTVEQNGVDPCTINKNLPECKTHFNSER